LRQVASFAISARLQPILRQVARRFPSVPFLCHHMAGARVDDPTLLDEVVASAALPNIHVKLSGFHYASRVSWDYPYFDTHWIVRNLYEYYGAERLCWGSDYPVVRVHMTYRQALEAFRTHCPFVPAAEQAQILGGNLQRLLNGER
jgi:predicted TIM-barrel fold metal-dependent hydrolase